MIIRDFQENDQKAVGGIFALYWTDPEFLAELSGELKAYIADPKSERGFLVATEANGEIIGVAGYRRIPEYLRTYALTDNAVELYVIAAKYKRRGIGRALKLKLIEKARQSGFTEILLYSPTTHDESWGFHDDLGFERVGEITPPDDEVGQLWRKIL
jgi:L-amino acid N-acyltransferase YncA